MTNKGKFKINKKLIKELKNILDQHVIGINNLTRYNNGLFEKIKNKLIKKLDKSELPVSVYSVDSVGDQKNIKFSSQKEANSFMYRDSNGRAQVEKPITNDDCANKQYVDEQIIAPGFVTKEYVDTQDQAILNESKQYTDDKDSAQKTYIDEQDETTLNSAKEYANTQDIETLNQAKEYTDEGLENKVDKLKLANKVYITNGAGADTSRDLSASANPNSIPVRNGQGNFQVSYPINDSDTANKKYVDEQIIAPGFVTKEYVDESILNSEHKVRPIIYGGTGASTVAGAISNLGLDGTENLHLIWTNSSPSSSFPSQSLNLGASSYKALWILVRSDVSGYSWFNFYRVEKSTGSCISFSYHVDMINEADRTYNFTSAGKLDIGIGIQAWGSGFGENNNCIKPYKIYGVKEI